MADNWPRYQHSFFMDEERNGPQTVIRGDEYKEFILDVEQARKDFGIPPLPKTVEKGVVEDLTASEVPYEEPPHPAEQTTVREVIKIVEESTQPVEEEYWVNESHTEKNPGRHFKVGKKSKKFLGWTDEPLTQRK